MTKKKHLSPERLEKFLWRPGDVRISPKPKPKPKRDKTEES